MWSMYNDRLNVTELQTMLREMSKHYLGIRRVNPDGIFGAETTAAVTDAQRVFDIPITGKVDYATWLMIYEMFNNNMM